MAERALPRSLVAGLIRWLKRKGVDYADVRYEHLLHQSLVAEQGQVASISLSESAGVGIRVLVKGSWGFAGTPHLTAASLQAAAGQAIELATRVSMINRQPRPLAPVEPCRARHTSRFSIDPFEVPLAKKLDYLLWANSTLLGPDAVKRAATHLDFFKRRKLFCSTEGAAIEQLLIESGAGLEVVVQQGSETQTRSFPNSHHGALAQAGFEYVKQLDLVGGAATAREEALQLLRAKPPRPGKTTLILDPTQVVMQLHESCGHPAELDRALGQELSYAGGSFLTPEHLGRLRYGSRHVTITADATIPGGVGSFGFDDEGVPAQRVPIVRDGEFVGYLSSRESAARIGLTTSSAAMRAESWSVPPLVRMTNVNLEPGIGTFQDLIRDTKRGILMATNKSWSIDDRRLNFQFGTEIGWEIRNGQIGQVLKNPIYTGITPEFWSSCSGITAKGEWQLYGVPNCAKGEPVQLMHVGHGASPARFEKVQVGRASR